MKKLTGIEIFEFETKFRNNEFPHQRYGQAFLNFFDIEGFSELFYMEDDGLARFTAWFNFLSKEE